MNKEEFILKYKNISLKKTGKVISDKDAYAQAMDLISLPKVN